MLIFCGMKTRQSPPHAPMTSLPIPRGAALPSSQNEPSPSPDDPKGYLACALRTLIHRKGCKQKEVAQYAGLSSGYVSLLKNARREGSLWEWAPIAAFFGLQIEQFVHLARLLNECTEFDTAYKLATCGSKNSGNADDIIDSILAILKQCWILQYKTTGKSIVALITRLNNAFPEFGSIAEADLLPSGQGDNPVDPLAEIL